METTSERERERQKGHRKGELPSVHLPNAHINWDRTEAGSGSSVQIPHVGVDSCS